MKAKASTRQVISVRTWNASQSWHHEATVRVLAHKIRIRIRRNAYDDQSYAEAQLFTLENGWKQICHRPISACAVAAFSYVQPMSPGLGAALESDTESLLAEAIEVLS